MATELRNVDTVILDLDGVLVDVSASYRRAVKETVKIVYGETIEDGHIQSLKDLGGFNNDWKVTYACALSVLAANQSPGFTFDRWVEETAERGTGLSAAVEATRSLLSEDDVRAVMGRWSKKKLWRIFQELYLGSTGFTRIENGEAVLERSGFIHEEPIIVEEWLIDELQQEYNVGVLTGRPRTEATIALERMQWDLDPEALVAMEDWDQEKPSPEGLLQLATYFGVDDIVYVGDTLDDIRTAENATETDPDRTYYGVGVLTGGLSGEEGRTKYTQTGADAILETINELASIIDLSGAPEAGL